MALVSAITGIRLSQITLTGAANHAGACPLDMRRDPMAGFAELADFAPPHAAARWGCSSVAAKDLRSLGQDRGASPHD